jgi:hypothetical protein
MRKIAGAIAASRRASVTMPAPRRTSIAATRRVRRRNPTGKRTARTLARVHRLLSQYVAREEGE